MKLDEAITIVTLAEFPSLLEYAYHTAAEYGRWNGEDYYENLWLTKRRWRKEHAEDAGEEKVYQLLGVKFVMIR